jgi:hypothetical protein
MGKKVIAGIGAFSTFGFLYFLVMVLLMTFTSKTVSSSIIKWFAFSQWGLIINLVFYISLILIWVICFIDVIKRKKGGTHIVLLFFLNCIYSIYYYYFIYKKERTQKEI